MPISGLVLRLVPGSASDHIEDVLSTLSSFEVGARSALQISGVIDALDYATHDAVLNELRELRGVCAVDIVFHDFSDVTHFDRLPKAQRVSR